MFIYYNGPSTYICPEVTANIEFSYGNPPEYHTFTFHTEITPEHHVFQT